MENSVDPTHTYYLHSHTLKLKGTPDFVPFHYQQLSKVDFELVVRPNWAGIQKQRIFAGADTPVEAPHPLIFPNILFVPVRTGYALHIRTPIDDSNTQVYQFRFSPTKDGSIAEQTGEPPIECISTTNSIGEFHLDHFASQDHMAWETQGPIADRSKEHLGEGDRGIIMLRKLLREQISAVEKRRRSCGNEPRSSQRRYDPVDSGRLLSIFFCRRATSLTLESSHPLLRRNLFPGLAGLGYHFTRVLIAIPALQPLPHLVLNAANDTATSV